MRPAEFIRCAAWALGLALLSATTLGQSATQGRDGSHNFDASIGGRN